MAVAPAFEQRAVLQDAGIAWSSAPAVPNRGELSPISARNDASARLSQIV